MEIEFAYLGIPIFLQQGLKLTYRGKELKQGFKPDFVCFEKIILEIKAVTKLKDDHRAQVLNYLNATRMKLGLLVNLGHYPKLEYERFILADDKGTYFRKG